MDIVLIAFGFALIIDQLLYISHNQELLMAARDELLSKIAELQKNSADTTAIAGQVAASLGSLRADLEAVKALLGDSEVNASAIEEALSKVTGLVDSTQANEDALLTLLPVIEPPVTE